MLQFRITQIIRNAFIRLEGFLSQLFSNLFGFLARVFGFLSKLFGFTASNYFLESDEEQGKKLDLTKPSQPETATANSATINRRRPDAKMDYYLNMARQTNKSD